MRIPIPFTGRSVELRFNIGENPPGWWNRTFVSPTSSGETVTEGTAMSFAVVYACIRVISESVGQIPLKVYERLPSGGKREASGHPLYALLHDWPNEEMTSFTWREAMASHLCGWGNCYSYIDFGRDGRPKSIELLSPDRVCPKRLSSSDLLVYDVTSRKGGTKRYAKEQILHVPGMGFDGIAGYSPIRIAAETIGAGMAAQKYIGAFFKNGAVPRGILEHPGSMSQEAQDRLRENWNKTYGGSGNAHKVAILEENMKFHIVSVNPVDAQLIETMKLSRSQIAGIFRVPAHMINDLDKATFSNVDQLSLEFVKFSLMPWLARMEQVFNRRLFLPAERGKYFCQFVTDGLLRGDSKSRNEAHRVAIMGGWKSVNEVRAEENMEPIKNGDKHFMQGAMMTIDQIVGGDSGGGGKTIE